MLAAFTDSAFRRACKSFSSDIQKLIATSKVRRTQLLLSTCSKDSLKDSFIIICENENKFKSIFFAIRKFYLLIFIFRPSPKRIIIQLFLFY